MAKKRKAKTSNCVLDAKVYVQADSSEEEVAAPKPKKAKIVETAALAKMCVDGQRRKNAKAVDEPKTEWELSMEALREAELLLDDEEDVPEAGKVKPPSPEQEDVKKKLNCSVVVDAKASDTIFVRGMSPSFDQEALKKLFAKWGQILEFSVPMRKPKPAEVKKGRKPVSRGIVFIRYASNKGAKRALELNNSAFAESTLSVTMSKSKISADTPKDEKRADAKQDYTVFVTNLPHTAEEADIKAHFRECGNIAGCRIIIAKGIAFIRYKREEGFLKGLELNGRFFQGREINVSKANSKARGDAPEDES